VSTDAAVAWLREAIAEGKALAEEARHASDGHWWRRKAVLYMDGEPEPTGALFSGDPVLDADGEVCGGEEEA
jgi:hypothetical protein